MNIALIVPTYNASSLWQEWIKAYQSQNLQANQVIVIDSSSTDDTVYLAKQAGFFVHQIAKFDFNHGGTRNLAVTFTSAETDILVFLTQDALFANPKALEYLVEPFKDPNVVAVCGRQLPHLDANPLATHARLFNYPKITQIKSQQDISTQGIKTAFMSNSFAAYRKSAFEKLGGFPNNTILAEDMHLTARMILEDYKVAYCAEAEVHHSHNYSLFQEFQRYFDTGVFQQKEQWIAQHFGKATGEGKRFVKSELAFLLKNNPLWIPKACLSTLFKFVGFKLGQNYYYLPEKIIKKCSMHNTYWNENNTNK